MKEIILKELEEIEKSEGVRILHCVESGSRAWGFASPDSDYDVRFIYVRDPLYYLRLDRTRDVIEWKLDDVLDVNGWDVQKALRLLHSSNPTLFEWAASPIVYKTTEEWAEISAALGSYFSPLSGAYHYLSTAKNNYRSYLKGEEVRLKKYFYVIRPLYACKWIFKYGTPPPMEFAALHAEFSQGAVREAIDYLLRIKTTTPEMGEGKRIDALNDFLDREIAAADLQVKSLPHERRKSWDGLNQIFYRLTGR